MRFAVLYCQGGGCDYSIACGQKFVMLPKEIDTTEEAKAR